MAVTTYDSQLRIGFLKSRPNLSFPLITVFPITHPIRVNPHLTHHILNVVGSLKADAEFGKQTQMVQD
jgi:hypothetical protein